MLHVAEGHFVDDVVRPWQLLIQHHAHNTSKEVRYKHDHDRQLVRELEKHKDAEDHAGELDQAAPVEE